MLHPRHKLQYFKSAGWEEEWVRTAENLVREEFEGKYAASAINDSANTDAESVDSAKEVSVSKVRLEYSNRKNGYSHMYVLTEHVRQHAGACTSQAQGLRVRVGPVSNH